MGDFAGARFERADFTGARLVACDLTDVELRGVDLCRVRIVGAALDEMADTPGVPRDRSARPSLVEVRALRADRVAGVRVYLAGLTDATLAADTVPAAGDTVPARSFPVRDCLLTVLNEVWEHRLSAERDLAVLSA